MEGIVTLEFRTLLRGCVGGQVVEYPVLPELREKDLRYLSVITSIEWADEGGAVLRIGRDLRRTAWFVLPEHNLWQYYIPREENPWYIARAIFPGEDRGGIEIAEEQFALRCVGTDCVLVLTRPGSRLCVNMDEVLGVAGADRG
jgi:hypothetical protein